jgi:hypothetical protein
VPVSVDRNDVPVLRSVVTAFGLVHVKRTACARGQQYCRRFDVQRFHPERVFRANSPRLPGLLVGLGPLRARRDVVAKLPPNLEQRRSAYREAGHFSRTAA